MSLETPSASEEDFKPLMTSDTDIDFLTASDADSILLETSRQRHNFKDTSSPNEVNYSSPVKDLNGSNRPTKSFRRSRHSSQIRQKYPSVGELLFDHGMIYSDVRLSFEDHGVLATRAGIPSVLRLHSIVLFQSQFFKDQLSRTSAAASSSPASNVLKEKQIIVRLPARVNEEDLINFYCTLRLLYTKKWDHELADNLAKGVGCLSVCYEIGFDEGIEACWKWLVRKCNRDRNHEMMKRLIEAYPNLHEQYTHQVEARFSSGFLDLPTQKSPTRTPSKRGPPLPRRSSRKSSRSSHLRRRTNSNGSGSFGRSASQLSKSNRSDASISTDASDSLTARYEDEYPSKSPSPAPGISPSPLSNSSLPSPPLSKSPSLSPVTSPHGKTINDGTFSPLSPPSPTRSLMPSHVPFPTLPPVSPPPQFNNVHVLNSWISKFESYAISSRRSCSEFPAEARQDSRCFPFLEHFVSVFESIIQLGRSKRLTSPECLDFTLRMLNVIKVEHAHFHSLHAKRDNVPPPSSPPPSQTSHAALPKRPESALLSPPIVLHESLDAPLSILLKDILMPIEQKHLCDYLWAPSNVSNLMHLREIRSDNVDAMEEDEFDGLDQVMGEISLVRGSRVSPVEHMVVGEKMAKVMKEIMFHGSRI